MPKYEIKTVVTGADQAAKEADKLGDSIQKTSEETKKASEHVETHTRALSRWTKGLRELIREVPVLGTILHALHNPIVLIGIAGAAAFDAIKSSIESAKASAEAWNTSAEKLKPTKVYSDLKTATDQLKESQDALAKSTTAANTAIQGQIDLLGESIEQQIKVLEAEKERDAARIEATEKDPLKRASQLAQNESIYGSRIAGMRGSLPGQQAQILYKQIAREKRLQEDAADEVPDEAALTAQVAEVKKNRQDLDEARRDNRKKFQRAELLRKVARGDTIDDFTAGQWKALEAEGIFVSADDAPDAAAARVAKANALLPLAEFESSNAKDRAARAQTRFRSGIGSLPPGAVKAGLLDGGSVSDFVDSANAEAAATENASHARQEALESQRDKFLRQQQGTITIDRINRETAGFKSDIAYTAELKKQLEETRRAILDFAKRVQEDTRRQSQNSPAR